MLDTEKLFEPLPLKTYRFQYGIVNVFVTTGAGEGAAWTDALVKFDEAFKELRLAKPLYPLTRDMVLCEEVDAENVDTPSNS